VPLKTIRAAVIAVPRNSISGSSANIWSIAVNGLSGRLLVQFEDLSTGLRHVVYVELVNQSLKPVSVINHPQIRAELLNSSGISVDTSGFAVTGPVPLPQWAVIPRDAYIGFRIDIQTMGVPTREHGVVLLALGGKSWELKAGHYVLKTTLMCGEEKSGPQNQWVGELALPPVEIIVTPEMLTVR